MQAQRFSTGGYVAHKIKLTNYATRFSAWFSADGELLDCEAIDARNRSRPVPAKARKALATMFGMVVAYSKHN